MLIKEQYSIHHSNSKRNEDIVLIIQKYYNWIVKLEKLKIKYYIVSFF